MRLNQSAPQISIENMQVVFSFSYFLCVLFCAFHLFSLTLFLSAPSRPLGGMVATSQMENCCTLSGAWRIK